jgi:hypothetical protein
MPTGKNRQAVSNISTAGGPWNAWFLGKQDVDAGRSYWKGNPLIFRWLRAVVLPPSLRGWDGCTDWWTLVSLLWEVQGALHWSTK